MNIIITESQYSRLVETQELDEGLLNTIGDIVGIFDPTGLVDITNSISYWRQGRNAFALLSLISAIPGADFITKPFILGGKLVGTASETKVFGWLFKTLDTWVEKALEKLDKLAGSKIPLIKKFTEGLRYFITTMKKSSKPKIEK